MNRRDVFSIGLLPLLNFKSEQLNEQLNEQHLIVIYLYVHKMDAEKVKLYVEKLHNSLKESKPSSFNFLLIPQREYDTRISIYSLGDVKWFDSSDIDRNEQWLCEYVSLNSLIEVQQEIEQTELKITDKEIIEYVKLMLGAPIIQIDVTDKDIQSVIEIGRRYNIYELSDFVFETIQNQRWIKYQTQIYYRHYQRWADAETTYVESQWKERFDAGMSQEDAWNEIKDISPRKEWRDIHVNFSVSGNKISLE